MLAFSITQVIGKNIRLAKDNNSTFPFMIFSGYKSNFEIYKSATAENFYITPHYGEIPGNKGINRQFVYIFVYFTPT